MASLLDYIEFLRKNGLFKEARFYFVEVPNLLKVLGHTRIEVLEMDTKKVMENLYLLKDTLEEQINALDQGRKNWEVELYGT